MPHSTLGQGRRTRSQTPTGVRGSASRLGARLLARGVRAFAQALSCGLGHRALGALLEVGTKPLRCARTASGKPAQVEGRRGKKAGFHTVFTVDRLDYGLGKKGGVGEEVEIIVSVEAGGR